MTGSEKNNLLKKMYFEILRVRRVEERIAELFRAGHIIAPVHLSIGQEVSAVGVANALRPQDKVVSTHRCHGHYLAKGGDLKKMLAELCGRRTGCASGFGGTMHLIDDEAGFVVSAPIVGASISFAVGIALASKIKSEDKVAVAFFGDGAVEEGIFWESVNFASVHRLPVLFVCEHNLYATHSPILKRQPEERITDRVLPHRVRVERVDGNDVLAVREAALQAVFVAANKCPVFLEIRTYRFKEHWGVNEDWNLGYRSREEGEAWMAKDPVKVYGRLFESENEEMEARIKKEIDEAVEFALLSPIPAGRN